MQINCPHMAILFSFLIVHKLAWNDQNHTELIPLTSCHKVGKLVLVISWNLLLQAEQNKQNLWLHFYFALSTMNKFDHLKISVCSTLPSLHLHTKLSGWTQLNSQSVGRVILINIRWDTFIAQSLLCLLFQKCAACTFTATGGRRSKPSSKAVNQQK